MEAAASRHAGILACALVALAWFVLVPAALADVSVDGNGTLRYESAGIVANNVTITQGVDSYTIIDSAPVTASAAGGCSNTDANTVDCPAASVVRIFANAAAGDDTVTVDATVGAQLLGGAGNDALTGGNGDDLLDGGSFGSDELDGGNGVDKVTYGSITSGVQVDLGFSGPQSTGGAGIDTLLSIENLEGTHYPDTLSGSVGANQISGLGGADTITTRDSVADQVFCGLPNLDPTDPDNVDRAIGDNLDSFSGCESVDNGEPPVDTTPPDTTITSGPGSDTDSGTVTFGFSSPDGDAIGFQCRIDGSDWVGCPSPTVVSNLGSGSHTFAVRAVDTVGNVDPSEATVVFTVNRPVTGGGGGAFTKTPAGNLVLIAGKAVKISKRRYATVALNCAGGRACAGRVILATSKPIRYSAVQRRRIVRLGSAKFSIPATRTRRVRIRISKAKIKLVRKLRRVPADVIVRDLDRAGRARVSTRTILLKAPK